MKVTIEFRHRLTFPAHLQPQTATDQLRLKEAMRQWAGDKMPEAREAMKMKYPSATERGSGFSILNYVNRRPQMLPAQSPGDSLSADLNDIVYRMFTREWFVDFFFAIEIERVLPVRDSDVHPVISAGRLG